MKKLLKFFIALVIIGTTVACLCFAVSAADNTDEFAGGDGSSENPYRVSAPAHLDNVRNYLNAYFIQLNDIDLTTATAQGGECYNANWGGWQAIGDATQKFNGKYDGAGYEIHGMKIDYDAQHTVYAGLFGYIGSGNVKNLGMIDSNIVIHSDNLIYVGGISGFGGMILASYNTGNIFTTSSGGTGYIGGIIGSSGGAFGCYNTGNIRSVTETGSVYAGGISGESYLSEISTCYNVGNVQCASETLAISGGIIGKEISNPIGYKTYNYCKDRFGNSYGTLLTDEQMKNKTSFQNWNFTRMWEINPNKNSGYPTLIRKIVGFAGGIGTKSDPYQVSTPKQLNEIGLYCNLNKYYIQTNDINMDAATALGGDCYNSYWGGFEPIGNNCISGPSTGITSFSGSYDGKGHTIYGLKINPSSLSQYQCAGLFGMVRSSKIENLGLVNSYISVVAPNYPCYVGGIVGNCYDDSVIISNCYNTGSISATAYSYAYVGGIAGMALRVKIQRCWNSGDVWSKIPSHDEYFAYSGGITGRGGIVTESWNAGLITAISGQSRAYAGGIAGGDSTITNCYNKGNVLSTAPSARYSYAGGVSGGIAVITNCYNTANISADLTGGIIGDSTGSATNCYCLDRYRSDIGILANTEEMKSKDTFFGWNFNTIWDINPQINSGFPYLRSNEPIISKQVAINAVTNQDSQPVTISNFKNLTQITLAIDNPSDLNSANMYIASYDNQGQLLDLTMQKNTSLSQDTIMISLSKPISSNAANIKVLIWNDNMQPLGYWSLL